MTDCNTAAPNPLPQYHCFHHPFPPFFFYLGVFTEVIKSLQELPPNPKEDLYFVHSPNLSHLFHDTAEVLIATCLHAFLTHTILLHRKLHRWTFSSPTPSSRTTPFLEILCSSWTQTRMYLNCCPKHLIATRQSKRLLMLFITLDSSRQRGGRRSILVLKTMKRAKDVALIKY